MVISPCTEWEGSKNEHGYGRVVHNGVRVYSHRLSFCQANGVELSSIKGMVVRHSCDNPGCVNPDHLLLGTQVDNIADMNQRGRGSKGESSGLNKLTESQVVEIRERYVPRDRVNGARALGREFGVSNANISIIISGKTWAHIGVV